MKSSLLRKLKSGFLEYFGITWITRSQAVIDDMEIMPQVIGMSGFAKAMSHYFLHYQELSTDPKLADFMRFYALNYSKSSSQWSQDLWVMYETKNSKSKRYLEIGGADGYTHSNTLSLEIHHGWTGTLVEPEKRQFRRLKIARKKNELINQAISPDGIFQAATLRSVGQLSSLKGFESNDVHHTHRMESRCFQKTKAIPLETILASNHYDYFSFDIEGAELSVLKSVNWNQVFKPKLLTIEHNSRPEEKQALLDFFSRLGYVSCFYEHNWLLQGDIWLKLEL